MFDIMTAWMEAARFGMDVQRVMALRMMRLAAGGALGEREAGRMVSEKLAAFGEAQLAFMAALATGASLAAATGKGQAPYRRRVRANRRRLSR